MPGKHGDPAALIEEALLEAGGATMRAPRARVTDRVNSEPPIINGMTLSEGKWIAVICLAGYALLGGLLAALTGFWPAMAVAVVFGTGLTLWYASIYLAKVKRGRPDGYYMQLIHVWIAGHGIARCWFLRRSSHWSLGREIPGGGFTSPLVVHENAPNTSRAPREERSPHESRPSPLSRLSALLPRK